MWRSCQSYSPAMARRLSTSRFSARVNWILSMYGSWFPSVSTQMLYGFRSSVHIGVFDGWTVLNAVTTGSSGFRYQWFLNRNWLTQLSNPPALAIASTLSWPAYLGWNC